MRQLEFELLPALGPTAERRRGSLVDLLRAIPYLLSARLVPLRGVLNDLLAHGLLDAGMSGGARWEPFSLSVDERTEVASALQADGFQAAPVPPWVQTLRDWQIWGMEYRFGVPAADHRRLAEHVQALEAARDAAGQAGDHARFVELHVAVFRADQELADFLRRYLPGSHA